MSILDSSNPIKAPELLLGNQESQSDSTSRKLFGEIQSIQQPLSFLARPQVLDLQGELNKALALDPFTNLQRPAHQSGNSDVGFSRSSSRATEAKTLAESLDYAKKHFAKIDTDQDGQLSFSEVHRALRKAEGTQNADKLVAVFSNFDEIRKAGESPLNRIFGFVSNGIDMKDINTAREEAIEEDLVDRKGNHASEAMNRHDLYLKAHADDHPVDKVHEAAAWLQTNLKKYDKTKDGALHQLEILSALLDVKDAKAKEMLTVLNDNYRYMKDMISEPRKDGITAKDGMQAMRDIEQKRDARDLGNALTGNHNRLFRALDGAQNGTSDGKITREDLETFVSTHAQRLKRGLPSNGIHTPENVAIVRDMLSQWEDKTSPIATLKSTVNGRQDFIDLRSISKAMRI